jgi:hypothetical protein
MEYPWWKWPHSAARPELVPWYTISWRLFWLPLFMFGVGIKFLAVWGSSLSLETAQCEFDQDKPW